ncbi:MAG: flap endonuclease, partial [Arthrobacter sp.]|nr:flap endonuclease [Arthrobacter sp.]
NPVPDQPRAELERLATEWNLGGSVRRLLAALDLRQ